METSRDILILLWRWCFDRSCLERSCGDDSAVCCFMLDIAADKILRGEY